MKQHITIEQVSELTQKEILKLSMKYYQKWYSTLTDGQKRGLITNRIDLIYVLSESTTIGKMIEILEGFGSPIIQYIDTKGVWNMLMLYADGEFEVDIEKNELADALWEAVKYVLKERENK